MNPNDLLSNLGINIGSLVEQSLNDLESGEIQQEIYEIITMYEKQIIESGEWKELLENNSNKKLSTLISEKAEEMGGEELVELNRRLKEEESQAQARMMQNLLGGVFGSMFGQQHANAPNFGEIRECESVDDENYDENYDEEVVITDESEDSN